MKQELDLRMEAAALSEMAENTRDDPGFRVPKVDWERTARDVLTTEWIDGTPISDVESLRAQGFDLVALGDTVIQSFLRHAIRDGFFHADMHQGNLFVDRSGQLVAVDFGIVGRLGPKESMFLAEILYGFITRDYMRVSQVHFEAGYVPRDQDPAVFAQAIRAIGEPIMDRAASEISMARLLTQLFEVTAQFNMQTQPQLLLLQKTMVVVEGVARTLESQPQHVGHGGTRGQGLDRAQAGTRGPDRGGGRAPSAASSPAFPRCSRMPSAPPRCCPTWRRPADCGSTGRRRNSWPVPRAGTRGGRGSGWRWVPFPLP